VDSGVSGIVSCGWYLLGVWGFGWLVMVGWWWWGGCGLVVGVVCLDTYSCFVVGSVGGCLGCYGGYGMVECCYDSLWVVAYVFSVVGGC